MRPWPWGSSPWRFFSSADARAVELTRVVSSVSEDGSFDFNLGLAWLFEANGARIDREQARDAAVVLGRDLKFSQQRHLLVPRLEAGLFPGVGLRLALPIVVADDRHLDFDGTSSSTATILRDGVLPGFGAETYGVDAAHGGRPFLAGSNRVFRGPTRRGIESFDIGVGWAIFDQRRDDTKPTWTMGVTGKLDLFSDMAYDAAQPGANTAVGLGYHQLWFETAVSRRFRYFDPYFGASFMVPIRTPSSAFKDYGGGQASVNPSMFGRAQAGTSVVAWEDARAHQSVTLEGRVHLDYTFAGRQRTEIWEALAGSSACQTDASHCRNVPGGDATTALDQDLDGDGKPDAFPGITDVGAYAAVGGDAGFNVAVGRNVKFRALLGLTAVMPHFLTNASAGVDRNGDGHVDSSSRTEANPTYREAWDLPGRRFKVEDSRVWTFGVDALLLF